MVPCRPRLVKIPREDYVYHLPEVNPTRTFFHILACSSTCSTVRPVSCYIVISMTRLIARLAFSLWRLFSLYFDSSSELRDNMFINTLTVIVSFCIENSSNIYFISISILLLYQMRDAAITSWSDRKEIKLDSSLSIPPIFPQAFVCPFKFLPYTRNVSEWAVRSRLVCKRLIESS